MISRAQLVAFKRDLLDGMLESEQKELIETSIALWNVVQMVELLLIRYRKGLPVKEHMGAIEKVIRGLT